MVGLTRVWESAMQYARLVRPNVGRKPETPFCAAGPMMEPPVSVPRANPTKPAATPAPGPEKTV